MKKVIAIVLAFLVCAGSALAEPWRVFDNAGLFDDQEKETLEEAIVAFQRSQNLDLVVLTTDDFLGEDVSYDVAAFFYDHGPYGFGQDASGLIYYLDMFNRVPTIVTTGDAIQALPDEQIDGIFDVTYPMLSSGDYFKAVMIMVKQAQAVIDSQGNDGNPSTPN